MAEKNRQRTKKEVSSKKNWFTILVIIICAVVFSVSAFKLFLIFNEYITASDEYKSLASLIPHINRENPEGERGTYEVNTGESQGDAEENIVPAPVFMENVDWQSLYSTMYDINNDYQGWIYISNTKINYPIVQCGDNDYYLNHTFYNEGGFSACLFIDCRIENGIEGKNVIVYGHNMKDGSMFAGLKKFRDEDFRKRHPAFSVYTSTGAYEYQIFSTYTTSPESSTYTTAFADDDEFMNYINRVKGWSDVDYSVQVSPDDQIITLSTCVNNNKDRYVVHAKRIVNQ